MTHAQQLAMQDQRILSDVARTSYWLGIAVGFVVGVGFTSFLIIAFVVLR